MLARRSLLALPAALLLLAACSPSKEAAPAGPLPAPAPLLEQSSTHTAAQTSVHIVMGAQGQVPNFSVRTLDGDLTSKPDVAAKGSASVLVNPDPKSAPMNLQFIVVDGKIYTGIGGKWTPLGDVAAIYPIGNILDPKVGLANIVGHIKNPVAEGRDQVEGSPAVRVSGTVAPEVLKGIYPSVAEELPAKVWVREDGNHELVKASIQVTPSASIDLTLSKWGEAVSVAKPA